MVEDPRNNLLRRLQQHAQSPFFVPEEHESLRRMEAFVRSTPGCFERSTAIGHITGSAWILDHARERVILLHHRKLGMWLQPGGHADGDPDVASVALREALEETRISSLVLEMPEVFDVDVHPIPARKREGAHFHYDVRFLFRAPPGAEPRQNEESHAVAWVRRDEVSRYSRDPSVLRLVRKWSADL